MVDYVGVLASQRVALADRVCPDDQFQEKGTRREAKESYESSLGVVLE
jgi:hypothetical protein